MSSFLKTVVAALAVSPAAAHMVINTPKPISASSLNNSPLKADGSDFPCKFSSTYAFSEDSEENTFSIGSADNKLAFTGSAVHGGGSCQVSITKDRPPTKDSVWKVVTSIEGGCPAQNMNDQNYPDNANFADPYTYNFTIPEGLEAGKYTLAWTWFNKVGNREMYMNCALATLEGSGGSSNTFDSLPDMAKANIENIGSTCTTGTDTDVEFNEPGEYVFKLVNKLYPMLNCSSDAGSSAGSGYSSTAAASVSVPATSAAYSSAPTIGTGGAFLESSAAVSAPTATFTAATTASATKASATKASVASASVAAASSSGSYAAGSACTMEGEWNCIGGSSYQRCASGQWSAVQQMASGVSCNSGVSATLAYAASSRVKRALRLGAKMLHI